MCFDHYVELTVRRRNVASVERGVLFTRTGRLCILFANGISLVFSRLGDPMYGI